jgi:hypothetical protein
MKRETSARLDVAWHNTAGTFALFCIIILKTAKRKDKRVRQKHISFFSKMSPANTFCSYKYLSNYAQDASKKSRRFLRQNRQGSFE